jgi:hypothetical protein
VGFHAVENFGGKHDFDPALSGRSLKRGERVTRRHIEILLRLDGCVQP